MFFPPCTHAHTHFSVPVQKTWPTLGHFSAPTFQVLPHFGHETKTQQSLLPRIDRMENRLANFPVAPLGLDPFGMVVVGRDPTRAGQTIFLRERTVSGV